MKVLMIQFMKGDQYGELESSKKLSPYLTLKQVGRENLSQNLIRSKGLAVSQRGILDG